MAEITPEMSFKLFRDARLDLSWRKNSSEVVIIVAERLYQTDPRPAREGNRRSSQRLEQSQCLLQYRYLSRLCRQRDYLYAGLDGFGQSLDFKNT